MPFLPFLQSSSTWLRSSSMFPHLHQKPHVRFPVLHVSQKIQVPERCFPLSCPIPTKDTHGEGSLYPWVSSSGNRLSCTRLEGHCHASFLPSVHLPLPEPPHQQACSRRCSAVVPPPFLAGSTRGIVPLTEALSNIPRLPWCYTEPTARQR